MAATISLDGLNPPQRKAVRTLRGPLLVLAGAGTGKTRVVTYRIANLIRHGVSPDRILAVTFTNKAANEMKSRVGELLQGNGRASKKSRKQRSAQPEVSTFHSLCVRVLRRHIDVLGYPLNFSICDRSEQESVARQALREIKVSDGLLRPADLLAVISQWKSCSVDPRKAALLAHDDRQHLASSAYRRYQETLKTSGALDFDDLLLCTEQLFQASAAAHREEAGRFDHILIDEYQDTNGSQYRIIQALSGGHRNLCVVGDDDQSIYGWRGAEVKHILRFQSDWPDATVVRLEENYRSTAAILDWANRLIEFNSTRHAKQLRAARPGGPVPRVRQHKTETEEAEQVVGEIQRHLAAERCEAGDVAILFRTKEQPKLFETELRKRRIPYVLIGSMSFFDRREVKDLLSFLQLMVKPDDDSALRRVVNVPARGVSRQAVQHLAEAATSQGLPMWELLPRGDQVPNLSPNAVKGCRRFHELLTTFRRRFETNGLTTTLHQFVHELDFLAEIRSRYDNAEEATAREATVEQIVNAISIYEEQARQPTLLGFLDEIALSNRDMDNDKEKQLGRNSVVLMTLHSAKGLEFPRVYIIGMEEGILPHHRSVAADGDAIEEERRLCYVGVTRAQDELTLSLALTRRKWGKPRPTDASRFLFEMTGQAERFQANRARQASARDSAEVRKKTTRRPGNRTTSARARRKR